jgi:MFS superfamily sulfate permease-like transporter
MILIPLLANEVGQLAMESELPSDTASMWRWAVSAITPVIIWLVGKYVPRVPRMLLPCLAPVVGIILGAALNKLAGANLGWVDMAQAGALAVFVRETVHQTITKRLSRAKPPSVPTPPAT